MKNTLFTLALLVSFNLFSQSLYKSSKISFYYPENYQTSERRLIQNVDVKLISNDNSANIVISEAEGVSSLDELKLDDLIDRFKSEIKVVLSNNNMTGKITVPRIERKNINNREFISFLVSTQIDSANINLKQLVYVYVKDGRRFNFIASGTANNYSSVLNYIIKDFIILK